MAEVLERDAGFCSGGDDDDMEAEDGIHSPTDASEDSVDVKVQAISLRNKNKRKCAEPRRVDTDLPAKKRKIGLVTSDETKPNLNRKTPIESSNCSPFRPWSASPPSHQPRDEAHRYTPVTNRINLPLKSEIDPRIPNYPERIPTNVVFIPKLPSPHYPSVINVNSSSPLQPYSLNLYSHDANRSSNLSRQFPVSQDEPLSLVSKKKTDDESSKDSFCNPEALRLEKASDVKSESCERSQPSTSTWHTPTTEFPQKHFQSSRSRSKEKEISPINRFKNKSSDKKLRSISEGTINKSDDSSHQSDNKFRIDSLLSSSKTASSSSSATTTASSSTTTTTTTSTSTKPSQVGQQRNYKNMTRERRIEANARERTRVHTISAAFDTLRHSIPAYSHNQKLSKLSVLRIACSYIMTLSRLAGYDYSKDQTEPELSSCVDNVSRTIQTEGKIRKKKDD